MVIIWAILAIILSAFWGIYGIKQEIEDYRIEEENKGRKMYPTKRIGIFLSEFIGSLAGWYCFYILIARLKLFSQQPLWGNFGVADIFLTIGAVIGMAGYSYKIVESVEKWK